LARVLAAIDLTPLGRRVADRARLLAEETDGTITVLHTVESATESFVPDGIAHLLADHQAEATRSLAEWCASRSTVPVAVSVTRGSATWEIGRASRNADVVVVGSSSNETGVTGATARRVAETLRCDVVVVRRQPRQGYRRVLVGVDLSEASAQAVDHAMRLAPDANEITLVFALATRFETFMSDAGMFTEEIDLARKRRVAAAEEAAASFAERWPEARVIVMSGPAPEVISETARRRSADLVVVGSRGANATRMVLLGSVPSALLDASPCDLAIARIQSEFRRP
jgi:nucleotide-binding universal stress UspA family protein